MIFSVVLYRMIVASEPVDKAFVPENIQKHEEFEEMKVVEEQYTPYKTAEDLFGGKQFDRTSTAKLAGTRNIFADDSVKTISGLNIMKTQREGKLNQDNLDDSHLQHLEAYDTEKAKTKTTRKPIV